MALWRIGGGQVKNGVATYRGSFEHPVLFTIVFADSLQMWWMFLVSCILKAWRCLLKKPRRFLQIKDLRANCMVEIFWNVGHLVFLPRCLYKWVDFPSISGVQDVDPLFLFLLRCRYGCIMSSNINNHECNGTHGAPHQRISIWRTFWYVFQLSND